MIALDTSAAICFVEKLDPARTTLATMIADDGSMILLSTIVIAEALPVHIRDERRETVSLYQDFFASRGVSIAPVDADVAWHAAHLQSTFKLKAADATHLATAILYGATTFATTDAKDFTQFVARVPIEVRIVRRYAHQPPPQ